MGKRGAQGVNGSAVARSPKGFGDRFFIWIVGIGLLQSSLMNVFTGVRR